MRTSPSSESRLPKVTSLVSAEPLNLPTVVFVLRSQNARVSSLKPCEEDSS